MPAEAMLTRPARHRDQTAGAADDNSAIAEDVAVKRSPVPAVDHPTGPGAADRAWRLDVATHSLARSNPQYSAKWRLTSAQKIVLGCGLAALAVIGLTAPAVLSLLLFATTGLLFAAVLALRCLALVWFVRQPQTTKADSNRESRCASNRKRLTVDAKLPIYTILVPLFREAAVVDDILASLDALDYPKSKLDIILALEASDTATQAAVAAHGIGQPEPSRHRGAVVVPTGLPQTKPRALNFAMTHARGDYVVVYDAEDAPEPNQLRDALAVFAAASNGDHSREASCPLACVQAQLNTRNPNATWLTRHFTLEYSSLFDAILPTLQWLNWPMPLGGTSNHFDRRHLEAVGGWDPYNVTEDADLGIRLARCGFRSAVVASTTWEEAPEKWSDWFGQRTRWLKGWMQSYLVHMRDPMRVLRELGVFQFAGLLILMAGMLVSAFVHPWFYVMLAVASFFGNVPPLFAPTFESFAVTSGFVMLAASYIVIACLGSLAVRRRGRGWLVGSALLAPIYWLAISAAAHAALCQFVRRPFFWAKTPHAPRSDKADPAIAAATRRSGPV